MLVALTALAACDDYVDPSITPNDFVVDGNRLYLSGDISALTLRHFNQIIADNPQISTVVELNVPGSIDEEAMIALGYRIRQLGLNTHLTRQSQIYSGGVDVFLAGKRRTIEPGAIIGVHAWADNFREATDYPVGAPEHAANRRYIQDMLGSDGFYWFSIHAAPASGVHIMTPAEIARFGLITG